MKEQVFHSVEELKAYLRSVPDDVIVKITVDEEDYTDGEADESRTVQTE